MGKQKIEYLNNQIRITDQLGKFERVNYEELKMLTHGSVSNLAPVTVIQKGKKKFLDIQVTDWYSLTAHYHAGLRQRSVFAFIWETLTIAIACERVGLRIENLSWNWDTIFVDNKSRRVKMIYWPIVSLEPMPTSVLEFYRGFVQVMGTVGIHKSLIQSYAAYFHQRESFDLHLFRQCVQQIMEQWKLQRHEQKQKEDEKQQHQQKRQEKLTGNSNFFDAWVEKEDGSGRFPLQSSVVMLGRDEVVDGLCIRNDAGVSRCHAKIICEEDAYYLVDMGSMNGTYHRNKRLIPQELSRLENGDRFCLSRSVYVFRQNEANKTLHIHDLRRRTL